jgi:hypothetical protein
VTNTCVIYHVARQVVVLNYDHSSFFFVRSKHTPICIYSTSELAGANLMIRQLRTCCLHCLQDMYAVATTRVPNGWVLILLQGWNCCPSFHGRLLLACLIAHTFFSSFGPCTTTMAGGCGLDVFTLPSICYTYNSN